VPIPGAKTENWTVADVEEMLLTLAGIQSVHVVAKPNGDVDEIHVVTSDRVGPKQTVRNVESALLAHFGVGVDHRKISVAQSSPRPVVDGLPDSEVSRTAKLEFSDAEQRIVFIGFNAESGRAHQVRLTVELEWRGQRHRGEAIGTDVPRLRMESVATATLRAVEWAIAAAGEVARADLMLALEGVRVVEAFDRQYALVGVQAMRGRELTPLSGASPIEGSSDTAIILATLQATDRWIRGRV
jgi:hypothetical protein